MIETGCGHMLGEVKNYSSCERCEIRFSWKVSRRSGARVTPLGSIVTRVCSLVLMFGIIGAAVGYGTC